MKKQKLVSRQIPIQLSANKKGTSLNLKQEQQLFQPYKIEWKNSHQHHKEPLRNQENNTTSYLNGSNSKHFYQNMKNQLFNIKQDVEKMILKQKKQKSFSTMDYNFNGGLKTINIKNKCQKKGIFEPMSYSIERKQSDCHMVGNQANCEDSTRLISDLHKNQYDLRKKEKQQYSRNKSKSIADVINFSYNSNFNNCGKYTGRFQQQNNQTLQQIGDIVNNKQEQQPKQKIHVDIDLPSFNKKHSDYHIENQKLIQNLKEKLNHLQSVVIKKDEELNNKNVLVQSLKENSQKQKKQSQNLRNQIIHLRNEMVQVHLLKQQISRLHKMIEEKCLDLNKLSNILTNQKKQIQKLLKQNSEISLLMINSKQNNQNLDEDNRKFKQKFKLKQNQIYIYQQELKQAKQKIRQLKELNDEKNLSNNQIEYKEIIVNDPTLQQENLKIKNDLNRIQVQHMELQKKLNRILRQNEELKYKNTKLQAENHLSIEKLIKNQSFANIGQEISNKFSEMVNENYSLKNKISHLQSNVDQLSFQNRSLKQEINIYEDKSKSDKRVRTLKIQDWDNLTDERDHLKEENDRFKERLQQTKQFYELQMMKKQNQISELKIQIEKLIDFGDEQKEEFHPNIRSIKHIKNFGNLLNQFRDMIEYNLEMQNKIRSLENKVNNI